MSPGRRVGAGAPRALRVVKRLAAEPARVFEAWLEPALARQWLFATAASPLANADVDARAGGAFRFVYARERDRLVYAGRYTEIVRPRRLAFALTLPEHDGATTRVTVEIAARKPGSTLTLVHAHVPAELAAYLKARWIGMLHGLALLLAQTRRQAESFRADDCRFHAFPFDYTMNPPSFTTL